MRILLCFLMMIVSGCTMHGSDQRVYNDLGVKEEIKYQADGFTGLSFHKYTNRKGTSVCAGSLHDGGFAIPCSFYEEL